MTTVSRFRSLFDQQNNPVLFLAPMAGITHSAFRRLVAQFGGHSALYTEMLPTHSLLSEKFATSPYTRRRPEEGKVIYQIVVTGKASLDDALQRLITFDPFAIDLNLGCPAPMVSRKGGGKALYADIRRLETVLETIRRHWRGPLLVKCRLGHETDHWRKDFLARLALFHRFAVDALCLHPRFFHEKLKRKARWNEFQWVKQHTALPLIGNGDMIDPRALTLLERGDCDGLMIGREAVRRPWVFKVLGGEAVDIDYWSVWEQFYRFTTEDFAPERTLGRIKEFTSYFADNFMFGHELFRKVQPAESCQVAFERAETFLKAHPATIRR